MTDKTTGRWFETVPPEKENEVYSQRYGSDVNIDLAKKMEEDVKFEGAMRKSFGNEGGYANNPVDRGGETMYGISDAQYPEEDKKNLQKDRARYIYYRDYYKGPKFDQLRDGIREQAFDAGIYKGQATVTEILQEAAGASVDGIIGPETVHKVDMADKHHLSQDFFYGLNADNEIIIKEDPSQETFRKGWYNRNKRMMIDH